MNIADLIADIQEEIEWMETTEGDIHQVITIENLEPILSALLEKKINLKLDD